MPRTMRILSIDGGGMRGIIPGEILVALENKFQIRTGNPHVRIADFFDLIAGTSAGGILTSLYLCPGKEHPQRPRYTAREVANVLLERGHMIFNIPLWQQIRSMGGLTDERYPAEPLEKTLRDYLGNVKLSQLVKPCLITAYDILHRRAYFFAQHRARQNKKHDFLARDAARASSAAPTFFEAAEIKSLNKTKHTMVDGGLFAGNPALCAYADAYNFKSRPTARDMVFLSLGPGHMIRPYKQTQHWGLIDWLKPLLDIFISGVSETVDYQLRQIFSAAGVTHKYLRIDPELDECCSPDMDNASPENLRNLQVQANKAIREHDADLDRMVELLLPGNKFGRQCALPRPRSIAPR